MWSEIISQHRDLQADNIESMACKQNLPCPALLYQPFAILGFDLFGNGWKLKRYYYGQQEVGWVSAIWLHYRLQPSTWWGITQQPFSLLQGRTDIHMHKKTSIGFLPKSTHAASSPYTWVWCFSQPKPIVYSTLDSKLWKPQSAFLAAAQH